MRKAAMRSAMTTTPTTIPMMAPVGKPLDLDDLDESLLGIEVTLFVLVTVTASPLALVVVSMGVADVVDEGSSEVDDGDGVGDGEGDSDDDDGSSEGEGDALDDEVECGDGLAVDGSVVTARPEVGVAVARSDVELTKVVVALVLVAADDEVDDVAAVDVGSSVCMCQDVCSS